MFDKYKKLIFLTLVCLLGSGSISAMAQLDDPMRPPGHRLFVPGQKNSSTSVRYTVSMVQISSLRRTAIVNNRLVEVGDVVRGAKILGIYPSSVKLRKQGKTFTVKLLSRGIKKRQ